jgi:hypothetical protein
MPKMKYNESTVLRWMHICNAVHGKHVQGFSDRRNDEDVAKEVQEYAARMAALEKRMPLWVKKDDGTVVHADRLREGDEGIDSGVRFDFVTYYEASGEEIPRDPCAHHDDPAKCRCHLPIEQWGHDEVRLIRHVRRRRCCCCCDDGVMLLVSTDAHAGAADYNSCCCCCCCCSASFGSTASAAKSGASMAKGAFGRKTPAVES